MLLSSESSNKSGNAKWCVYMHNQLWNSISNRFLIGSHGDTGLYANSLSCLLDDAKHVLLTIVTYLVDMIRSTSIFQSLKILKIAWKLAPTLFLSQIKGKKSGYFFFIYIYIIGMRVKSSRNFPKKILKPRNVTRYYRISMNIETFFFKRT